MKTLLSLAALAAAFTALPASAQTAAAPASVAVATADLDRRSPAGIAALDRRIHAAVRTLCGEASDVDLHGKNAVGKCRVEALAQAETQRAQAIASTRTAGALALAAQ